MATATHNGTPVFDQYDVFVEGTIVSLASGGPDMTVVDYCDNCDMVTVAWFDGNDELSFADFPGDALVSQE